MPATQMVRSRTPSSATSSRMVRSAPGSPHPGQSECSLRSSRSGAAKTFSSSLIPPSSIDLRDPAEQGLDVEEGPDAEARVIVADAADRVHGHAAADGELDVLDHLSRVELEDRHRPRVRG